MTGIELEEMNENDTRAKDAERLAEEILTPHKVFRPKSSSVRRKSILNPVEETPLKSMNSNFDSVFPNRLGNRGRSMSNLVCVANATQYAATAFKKRLNQE